MKTKCNCHGKENLEIANRTYRWCDSCLEAGEHTAATTHSSNSDWDGYNLCDECAAEYDKRGRIENV
jgi:superfamily II helicase